MFEGLTLSALTQRAFFQLRDLALERGHAFVAPAHILLGLLNLEQGVAAAVLDALDVDRDALRLAAERDLPAGSPVQPMVELPYTPPAVAVLEGMAREARDAGTTRITTGHVLVALLQPAAGPMPSVGALVVGDLDALRAHVAGAPRSAQLAEDTAP